MFLVNIAVRRPVQETDLLTEAARINLTIKTGAIQLPFKVKLEASIKRFQRAAVTTGEN